MTQVDAGRETPALQAVRADERLACWKIADKERNALKNAGPDNDKAAWLVAFDIANGIKMRDLASPPAMSGPMAGREGLASIVKFWRDDALEKAAQIVEQYRAGVAVAYCIRELKSKEALTPSAEPVAWIAIHVDRGMNFGTMAETEQGATSRLMMTGIAGVEYVGWKIIPLSFYASPPAEPVAWQPLASPPVSDARREALIEECAKAAITPLTDRQRTQATTGFGALLEFEDIWNLAQKTSASAVRVLSPSFDKSGGGK